MWLVPSAYCPNMLSTDSILLPLHFIWGWVKVILNPMSYESPNIKKSKYVQYYLFICYASKGQLFPSRTRKISPIWCRRQVWEFKCTSNVKTSWSVFVTDEVVRCAIGSEVQRAAVVRVERRVTHDFQPKTAANILLLTKRHLDLCVWVFTYA